MKIKKIEIEHTDKGWHARVLLVGNASIEITRPDFKACQAFVEYHVKHWGTES